MTYKPILFNTPMTRAILDGRKSATRRDPFSTPQDLFTQEAAVYRGLYMDENHNLKADFRYADGTDENIKARYQPGDILWVRETWCELARVDANGYTHYDDCQYYYATDGDYQIDLYGAGGFLLENQKIKWHPSIHMPREAARLFLRVTSVRAERLQNITEDGIVLEGISRVDIVERDAFNTHAAAEDLFARLWDSTIKPADREWYGWDANPWVWVIEFERCEKPEGWCE